MDVAAGHRPLAPTAATAAAPVASDTRPMTDRLRVAVEAATKRTFVIALDWPGWARAGKTEEAATASFLAAAPRYGLVAERARFPIDVGGIEIDVVERLPGNANTEFGVPWQIGPSDAQPADAAEAARLAALVTASWVVFDEVAAAAPEELRKGPRGGGRDRSKIVDHVNGADRAYAGVMGIRTRGLDVAAVRAAMLELLRAPSDGSPLGGRKWPVRYAARRIAWHALDHTWEIEDRTDPA
jgi:hypothetical protein